MKNALPRIHHKLDTWGNTGTNLKTAAGILWREPRHSKPGVKKTNKPTKQQVISAPRDNETTSRGQTHCCGSPKKKDGDRKKPTPNSRRLKRYEPRCF